MRLDKNWRRGWNFCVLWPPGQTHPSQPTLNIYPFPKHNHFISNRNWKHKHEVDWNRYSMIMFFLSDFPLISIFMNTSVMNISILCKKTFFLGSQFSMVFITKYTWRVTLWSILDLRITFRSWNFKFHEKHVISYLRWKFVIEFSIYLKFFCS